MKMLTIPISPENIPSDMDNVLATSWEIAIYPDFKVENYIIARMLESSVNRTELTVAIDETKLVNKNVYYRYKFHYANNVTTDWAAYKVFSISDMVLPNLTSLIEIPVAKSWVDYREEGDEVNGYICTETSAYRDYSNTSTHYKTLCTVISSIGAILYTEEAIKTATLIQGNLQYFEIPVEVFKDNDMYTINITYVGNNGITSGVLNHTFESYLVEDAIAKVSDYATGNKITSIEKGKVAYFKISPKTTQFKSINMHLMDVATGEIISQNLNQFTVYPKLNIPNTVTIGKVYAILVSINLLNGISSIPATILTITIDENVLKIVNVNATYKDKFSYMGSVNNAGLSIQSTEQLDDGYILIANTDTLSIDMYSIVNEELVFYKKAIEFPLYDDMSMLNVNIVKLYNGKVLVNYSSHNKNILGQEQVFNLYEYNAGNKKFTLTNQVRLANMGDSTASSSSLFIAPNNDIYFIPAIKYDLNGNKELLKMHKIDTNTFLSSIVSALPFNAIKHVSMAPTEDPNKFIIFNGSANEYRLDNRIMWKRENQKVYSYDVSNGIYTDLEIDMSVLPQEMYNIQGYLRRDGKIILFNSSSSGTTIDFQNTALIDLSIKEVIQLNNDLPDNMIYRSTIVLNNGEFIRMISNQEYSHSAYRYIGDSLETVVTPILENRNSDLLVPYGQTITVDDLSIYGKVIIQGTSLADTGTLISIDPNLEGSFDYSTLIISGSTVLTSTEYNSYANVIIINDASVQLLD